jgi:predicted ATPase
MIRRIQALNYRCLRYVDQSLDRFNVLVGANASGKTTFLDVVAFLRDLLKDGPEEAVTTRAQGRGLAELCWRGSGTRFDLAVELTIPDALRERIGNGRAVCRYEITVAQDHLTGEIQIGAENLWLTPDLPRIIPREAPLFPVEPTAPNQLALAPRGQAPPGCLRVVEKESKSGNDGFHSETSAWTGVFRLGPNRAALANLPEDDSMFPVGTWAKRTLIEGVQSLSLNSLAMRQSSPSRRGSRLRDDGSNLPAVVRALRDTDPVRFSRWLAHIRTALPDVSDVGVVERQDDKALYLEVAYSTGVRVPSRLVSDGTLRLLALTLLAYILKPSPVCLIEEPENGLHPRAVETVFQSLSSVYDAQVLVATHSPVMLGLASPESILCFAKTETGATDIVRGSEHPKLRDWRGEVHLSELYAAGVLG